MTHHDSPGPLQVWASKWTDRAWLSRRALGVPDSELYMSVLLQQVGARRLPVRRLPAGVLYVAFCPWAPAGFLHALTSCFLPAFRMP